MNRYEIVRMVLKLFLSLLGSLCGFIHIDAATPAIPILKKPAAGIYQGATVSVTSSVDAQIRYRINGSDWRKSDSPLEITLFSAPFSIDYQAVSVEGESEIVNFTVGPLRNTTPYVITNSASVAGETQCIALSSEAKKTDPATELYGIVMELTPDNELLIDRSSIIWHTETNKENAALIGSNGSYLYVVRAGQTNLGYRSNIFNWYWNEASKMYEYKDGSTIRTLMYGAGSPGGFKAFASGNFNKPGYASGSVRYPVERVCIDGPVHDSRINYLLSLQTLKTLDLRKALFPEKAQICRESGNPNCLVYTGNLLNLPDNEICGGVCSRLVLSGRSPFGFYSEFIASEASYTRTTREDGDWETILVPFDVKENAMPSDYLFYGFDGLSADGTTVNFNLVTELNAHTSYLMRYAGQKKKEERKELLLQAEGSRICVQKGKPAFTGVYKQTGTEGKYLLGKDPHGNTVFLKGDANSYAFPFEAYLDLPSQSERLLIAPFPDIPDHITATHEADWSFQLIQPGMLMIKSKRLLPIILTGIDGRVIRRCTLPAGEHVFRDLSSGVYFLNGKKILLD